MNPIPVEDIAAISRAIVDKTNEESRPLPWPQGTVAGVDLTAKPFPTLTVHMDGSPPDKAIPVPVAGASAGVSEGDRVVVAYVHPNGAWAFPMNSSLGTITAAQPSTAFTGVTTSWSPWPGTVKFVYLFARARTAPSGGSFVATLNVNDVAVGTVTIENGELIGSATIDADVQPDDYVDWTVTSANGAERIELEAWFQGRGGGHVEFAVPSCPTNSATNNFAVGCGTASGSAGYVAYAGLEDSDNVEITVTLTVINRDGETGSFSPPTISDGTGNFRADLVFTPSLDYVDSPLTATITLPKDAGTHVRVDVSGSTAFFSDFTATVRLDVTCGGPTDEVWST